MALLLAIVFALGISVAHAADSADFDFQPCTLTGSSGNGVMHAECATWQAPLDYERPDGETIEIFVARVASTSLEPALDAMTLINGGPGGSSVDMLVDFSGAVRAITRERDLIVIDQRGTGRSTPLSCEGMTETADTPSMEEIGPLTEACLSKLPHDPRFFSTSVAVRDLEEVRKRLGYAQLSLYGVSYGTRVALHYLKRHPDSVRSLVIDGVVPPEIVLGSNVAFNSDETLHRVFEMCAENSSCRANFPDLEQSFDALSERLKQNPVALTLAHPVTGKRTDIEVTYGHLAIMVRLALYGPEMRSLIPMIVREALVNDNYVPIASNALRMIHQLTESLTYGMHNAVVCTEDAPFYDRFEVDMDSLDATYLGSDMYRVLAAMCDVWPPGVIDPDFKDPVESDVPTLVLSGEFDPITPPRYGDDVLVGLSNATHIVGKGQGHGVLVRGCMPKVVLEFVEAASTEELDLSCAEHLGSRPFFINMMGPAP